MTPSCLVIVPAWNEAASVGAIVSDIRAAGYDVLVVDDGSTDGTAAVARAAGVTVARLPVNLGVGGALRCGFRYAVRKGYEAVVQVDADGQHPVSSIDQLVTTAFETDVHMLIGSRFAGDEATSMAVSGVRRAVMRILARSASRATRATISDATSGFRCIREPLLSEFARDFPTHYLGDTYEAVVSAGRAGYRVREIPADLQDRTHGVSSASTYAAFRLTTRAAIVVATRLQFPLKTFEPRSEPQRQPGCLQGPSPGEPAPT